MIFRHRKSGVEYVKLMDAWDTNLQVHSIVYVSLKTGQAFVRDREKFYKKFEFVENRQLQIQPKEKPSEQTGPVIGTATVD